MLKKLRSTFGSYIKAQEILLLINNKKEVVRQGFYDLELHSVKQFCKKNDLHLIKSKFKVIIADREHFSNKGIRVPNEDQREGMHFYYIAKDELKANLAAYYELMNNHQDLGKTLGYPHCCIEFFSNNFSKTNPNPQLQPTNMWTNLTKRNNDVALLSHFPCSSECKESIKQAKTNFDLIMKIDLEHSENIINELKEN
jgi:hypothetical protein